MKRGKIIPNGVSIQKHEYDTVLFLTELGYDVELVPKSDKPGEHTPDIRLGSTFWEMKAPKGEGKWLIANSIQRALKQSPNIILDLRRAKRHQSKCIAKIKREFNRSRSIQCIKIISKDGKILELQK